VETHSPKPLCVAIGVEWLEVFAKLLASLQSRLSGQPSDDDLELLEADVPPRRGFANFPPRPRPPPPPGGILVWKENGTSGFCGAS
jgi:hypothetical protein